MKNWKSISIMAVLLISIAITGTAHAQLVQGQVNQNGTLWIVSYETPTGTHYPEPFQTFHANNLSLTVYSPLTSVQNASITVKSQIGNQTVYENQTLTVMPHEVQNFNLKIPLIKGTQEISITWSNNTVIYFIQTYQPVNFPFGNNPLGLLALIGVIMLAFTGINIALTKGIIDRAKHFPKLSQRAWIGMITITGLIIYNVVMNYYYDLTGEDWALWLIPLWAFNLLMILSAWPSNAQAELMIHIRETQGNDLETGLYAIKTAPMTEKEKGKYPVENHSGKEYIDSRSYIDFLKRLAGIRIPIVMETSQQPDTVENTQSKRIKRTWKMKDRVSKEHPFKEAVLLDPLEPQPVIEKVLIPTGKKAKKILKKQENTEEPPEKMKKIHILRSHLNGKHMKEAEYFLADYITASESGKKIHQLSKDLAINQASLNTKAYNFQDEIINHVFKVIGEEQEYIDFKAKTLDPKAPKEREEPNKED